MYKVYYYLHNNVPWDILEGHVDYRVEHSQEEVASIFNTREELTRLLS